MSFETGQKSEKLKELETERTKAQSGAFLLSLEVLVIFGGPAVAAIMGGKYIENAYGTRIPLYVFIVIAFVVSWAFMISRVMKIDRKMRVLDEAIKEEKQKLDLEKK